jgi:FixJ family two-component response regulator
MQNVQIMIVDADPKAAARLSEGLTRDGCMCQLATPTSAMEMLERTSCDVVVGDVRKAGAVDFLRKPVPPKKLLAQIREAIEVDRRARDVAAQRATVTDRVAQLTPRETQVMELLAVGSSSKEIATALSLSTRTVEGHRRNVLRKMGVESAVQLARAIAAVRRR